MIPPNIETSTKEERLTFVQLEWQCMHNGELCGKCHILKGYDVETIYAKYIEGKKSYLDITLGLRELCLHYAE